MGLPALVVCILGLTCSLWATFNAELCDIVFHTESSPVVLFTGDDANILCDASCFRNYNDVYVIWFDPSGRPVDVFPNRIFAIPSNRRLLSRLVIVQAALNIAGTYVCSVMRSGQLLQQKSLNVFVFGSSATLSTNLTDLGPHPEDIAPKKNILDILNSPVRPSEVLSSRPIYQSIALDPGTTESPYHDHLSQPKQSKDEHIFPISYHGNFNSAKDSGGNQMNDMNDASDGSKTPFNIPDEVGSRLSSTKKVNAASEEKDISQTGRMATNEKNFSRKKRQNYLPNINIKSNSNRGLENPYFRNIGSEKDKQEVADNTYDYVDSSSADDGGGYGQSRRKREANNSQKDVFPNNTSVSTAMTTIAALQDVASAKTTRESAETTTLSSFTNDVKGEKSKETNGSDFVENTAQPVTSSDNDTQNVSIATDTTNENYDDYDEDKVDSGKSDNDDEDELPDDVGEDFENETAEVSENTQPASCLRKSNVVSNFGKYGVPAFAVSMAIAAILLCVLIVMFVIPRFRTKKKGKAGLQCPTHAVGTGMGDFLALYMTSGDASETINHDLIDLDRSLTPDSECDGSGDDGNSKDAAASVSTFLLRRESHVNTEEKHKNTKEDNPQEGLVVIVEKT